MNVSPLMIAKLARRLLVTYNSLNDGDRPADDLLLDATGISDGLTKLVTDGLLNLGSATEVEDVTDDLVKKVIKKLKKLQKETGVLLPDGVFGARTLKWLLKRPFGHFRPGRSIGTAPTTVDPDNGINSLTYFVETGELQKLGGISLDEADRALQTAWLSWAMVCDIVVTQVGTIDESNVKVSVRKLDGEPPSVLAIADVGPPGRRRLELAFDIEESWSVNRLQATACHEIGHILGIRHIGRPRQLMNDTLHDDILTPREHDIAAAIDIWGE